MMLTAERRGELESVMRKHSGNAALARRARCVLLWADGERRVDIRAKLACNDAFVTRWSGAYGEQQLASLVSLYRDVRRSSRWRGWKRACWIEPSSASRAMAPRIGAAVS